MSLIAQGQVRYQLNTPYRDSITRVVIEVILPPVRETEPQGVVSPRPEPRVPSGLSD